MFADDAIARLHRAADDLPRALNDAAIAALIAAATEGKETQFVTPTETWFTSSLEAANAEVLRYDLTRKVQSSTGVIGAVRDVRFGGAN